MVNIEESQNIIQMIVVTKRYKNYIEQILFFLYPSGATKTNKQDLQI